MHITEHAPTMSVDRAAAFHWENLEIDTEAIAQFYEALPHINKPQLADCSMYFSGLYLRDGSKRLEGVYTGGNSRITEMYDESAPPCDIIIFLGSALCSENPIETLNAAIQHELVHYAQRVETKPVNFVALRRLLGSLVWKCYTSSMRRYVVIDQNQKYLDRPEEIDARANVVKDYQIVSASHDFNCGYGVCDRVLMGSPKAAKEDEGYHYYMSLNLGREWSLMKLNQYIAEQDELRDQH